MLSIEECKKYLHNTNLADEEIESVRDILVAMANILIEDYYDKKKPDKPEEETQGNSP